MKIRPVQRLSVRRMIYTHWGQDLSQKSRLFNRFVWEPMNYEGFQKAFLQCIRPEKCGTDGSCICKCAKRNSGQLPHMYWPAQAAVHAGMKRVINADAG